VRTTVGSGLILEGRRPQGDALIVAFAVAFAFDAVLADWSFLTALDTAFAAGHTSSLGPFARQLRLEISVGSRGVGSAEAFWSVAIVPMFSGSAVRCHTTV